MKKLVVLGLLIVIILSTLIISTIRHQYGIDVEDISLDVTGRTLQGLYMKPVGITAKVPGVVVIHGFSATKEMMRPFAEGLAEAGYVILSIDMLGHGLSEGFLNEDGENSLINDVSAAITFLRNQEEVNSSSIGLIGHSMGGSAAIRTSIALGDISATIVIGNSLRSLDVSSLNSGFPQNVMMAIGTYDELFSIDEARQSFSHLIEGEVVLNQIYGTFHEGSARKLVTAKTDHVFEVIAPNIIDESLAWMINALPNEYTDNFEINPNKYIFDQLITLISALSILTIIPIFYILSRNRVSSSDIDKLDANEVALRGNLPRHIIVHGLQSLLAFGLGSLSIFIFANSYQFLFIGWYISGSIIYGFSYYRSRKSSNRIIFQNWKTYFNSSTMYSFALFFGLFVSVQILLYLVTWDFRFVFPVLSAINLRRIPMFLFIFIPGILFFIFEIEQLDFAGRVSIKLIGLQALARLWTFMIVLCAYLLPIVLFHTPLLPSIVGFLSFFLIGFLPVLLIVSVITQIGISTGNNSFAVAVPVSGIIAWMLSANLPFIS